MRTATFEVPSEIIGDFTEKMTELGLENAIVGKTEDDEIEIEVYYEKSEAKEVDTLEDYFEDLKDSLDNDDDDEKEEDEDK